MNKHIQLQDDILTTVYNENYELKSLEDVIKKYNKEIIDGTFSEKNIIDTYNSFESTKNSCEESMKDFDKIHNEFFNL